MKNKGQSPIQYATIILVIVALVGSWMAYSSAGTASTKRLAGKKDISKLKKDISKVNDRIATLEKRIKSLQERQSTLLEKIGAKPTAKPTAKLSVTSISAPSVKTGKKATVKVTVVNTGKKAGSIEVAPTIKGEEIGSKTVELEGGETKQVEFTVRKEESGEYTIKADGKTTTLTVTKPTYKIGYLPADLSFNWFRAFTSAGRYYAQDAGVKLLVGNPQSDPSKEIKLVHRFIDRGVDAIVWSPVTEKATVPAAKAMEKNGVVDIVVDRDVDSPLPLISISFSNKEACRRLAKKAVDYLKKKKGDPNKIEEKRLVFEDAAMKTANGRLRHEGYMSVFNKYPKIETHTVATGYRQSKAFTKMKNLISKYGKPDVICGSSSTGTAGDVNALDAAGMLKKRGKEGHVFVVGVDGSAQQMKMLEKGWTDYVFTQPNLFYGPLGIHYALEVLRKGKQAIPDVGETVTSPEDVDISSVGTSHAGANPWKEPFWSPGKVVKAFGHKHLDIHGKIITPKDTDASWIWGNLVGKWF